MIAAFELRDRLSRIPGVENAALEQDSPIGGESGLPISLPGLPPNPANRFLIVGPAYFATMQIPILVGRDFQETDRRGSPSVAIVNQVFAKANFGDPNPLGQRLILRKTGEGEVVAREMEIVGVSRNARYGELTRAIPPVVYMPYDQGYPQPDQMVYVLRTAGDPLRYVNSVRKIVGQTDPSVPVSEIRTQAADIDRTINQQIVFADLCSGFAILALLIACVGLYGAVSYDVSRRIGEIGIRMALGAQRRSVLFLVLREVLLLATVGLAIGMSAALVTFRFVESFLYGIKPNDPVALTLAVTVLLGAALLAAYLRAWKASRVDPMTALRHE